MTVCVYAIVAAPVSRIGGTGVAGEKLRRITAGRLTAIAGELRRPPKPTMTNLRRYAKTIETIAGHAPAILPARFGTCMTDIDELTFVLRSRQAALRRRLRAVRGRAQMTVRVVLPLGSDPRAEPSPGSDPGDGPTQGRQYLQQRARSAAAAREVPGFEPVRTAVARWVKDERVDKQQGVATVNHLIPRALAASYRAALERAARDAGIRLIVSGPYPPYAFADTW